MEMLHMCFLSTEKVTLLARGNCQHCSSYTFTPPEQRTGRETKADANPSMW